MGRDTCPSRWRGSFDLPLMHKSIIFNRTEKMCLMSRPALSYHSRYLDGVPLVITQGDWHKLIFLLKYQACSLLTFSYKARKLHYNCSSKRKTPLYVAIRKLNLWLYVNCNRKKIITTNIPRPPGKRFFYLSWIMKFKINWVVNGLIPARGSPHPEKLSRFHAVRNYQV